MILFVRPFRFNCIFSFWCDGQPKRSRPAASVFCPDDTFESSEPNTDTLLHGYLVGLHRLETLGTPQHGNLEGKRRR